MAQLSDYYCTVCEGTGITPDGEICKCREGLNYKGVSTGVACLDIPKQYFGRPFQKHLIPLDLGQEYIDFMSELYENLVNLSIQSMNILICSPIAHSKSIMAYAVMERLYRAGVTAFPMVTVPEIQRVYKAVDNGSKCTVKIVHDADKIDEAPVIFVKIPMYAEFGHYAIMHDLISRRSRYGLTTILLSNQSLENMTRLDTYNVIKSMKGDGKFGTIQINDFFHDNNNFTFTPMEDLNESI